MGSLNRLFGSTESIAKNAEKDEGVILKNWKEYLSTISKKEEMINRLPYSYGQRMALLQKLNQLLDLELVDIYKVEKEEDDLVFNLESLEHNKKIKRVHKLEVCLRYFDTRHEYVYELLRHLYSVLKSEGSLLKKLKVVKDLKKFRKLVNYLKSEFKVEQTLLKKIGEIETFHNLFSALVKGEHIIHRMDSRERKILNRMQQGMYRVFSEEIKEKKDVNGILSDIINPGITNEWVVVVFNAVEDKVHKAVAEDILEYHPDVKFEFVNRPEFVVLVRAIILAIRSKKERERYPKESVFSFPKKKGVSEQMINVFVHLFREWYNHGRV